MLTANHSDFTTASLHLDSFSLLLNDFKKISCMDTMVNKFND